MTFPEPSDLIPWPEEPDTGDAAADFLADQVTLYKAFLDEEPYEHLEHIHWVNLQSLRRLKGLPEHDSPSLDLPPDA